MFLKVSFNLLVYLFLRVEFFCDVILIGNGFVVGFVGYVWSFDCVLLCYVCNFFLGLYFIVDREYW